MSKLLTDVRLRPHRISLAGALCSLLVAVGRDLPQHDVIGASGHAFRLTLDLLFSPAGPVDLNFHDLFPLWENLGAWFKRMVARPGDTGFAEARKAVLARVREAIDRGWPVIMHSLLNLPEYGLVVGYDGERYACLTLNNPDRPEWMAEEDWPAPAHPAFARAEAIFLIDVAPNFDRRRAEVQSLRFAVDHFWAPPSSDSWLQHGRRAYEFWIATLASSLPLHGGEPGIGHSYNLLLLQRARREAAVYLTELASRYDEAPSIGIAAVRYGEVAATIAAATELLPFPGTALTQEAAVRAELADLLRRALAAERQGIDEIERALRVLRRL